MSSTDRPEVKRFMADTYYGYGGQPTMQQCVLATDYDALEVESRDWRARYLEAADILKTRVVEQSSLTKRITELEGALRKALRCGLPPHDVSGERMWNEARTALADSGEQTDDYGPSPPWPKPQCDHDWSIVSGVCEKCGEQNIGSYGPEKGWTTEPMPPEIEISVKSSGGYDDDEGRLLLKRATSVEQTCRWPVTSDDAEWLKNPHNVVHPYVCFPVEDLGEAPYCPNCGKRIEISGEQTDEIAEQQIENYYANGGTPMEEEMGG